MADSNGVVYSLAYGDQPAIIRKCVRLSGKSRVRCCNCREMDSLPRRIQKIYSKKAMSLYGHLPDDFAGKGLNPKMYNSFLDGTKSAIEMCAVASMTGLVLDVPGMHFPPYSMKNLPKILSPIENGGLLNNSGVVEVVSCIDESGKYGAMYRPYYLVGIETPFLFPAPSSACIRGEPSGAPKARIGHVATVAKKPLSPSDVLDGEGRYTVYGQLEEYSRARSQNILPVWLCHNARVIKHINEDQILHMDDVELMASDLSQRLSQ